MDIDQHERWQRKSNVNEPIWIFATTVLPLQSQLRMFQLPSNAPIQETPGPLGPPSALMTLPRDSAVDHLRLNDRQLPEAQLPFWPTVYLFALSSKT